MLLVNGEIFKSNIEDPMPLIYGVTAPDLLILPFCEVIGMGCRRCPDPWGRCNIRGYTVPPPAKFDEKEESKSRPHD